MAETSLQQLLDDIGILSDQVIDDDEVVNLTLLTSVLERAWERLSLITLTHPLEESGVIAAVIAEYDRAKAKHGKNTLDGELSNDTLRLAALVEEVGEVAELLTYDRRADANSRYALKNELTQVATVAATWASIM